MTTNHQPDALLPLPEAEAWVISLDCDMRGFMDAKAWKEDEFTTPLFTADQMRAYATEHAAKLHAECEAMRADAERYRWLCLAAGDWGVCEWDTSASEWVRDSRGQKVISAAIDAARAAKEQSK